MSALEQRCSKLQISNRDLTKDLEREKRSRFTEEGKLLAFEAVRGELKALLGEETIEKRYNDDGLVCALLHLWLCC